MAGFFGLDWRVNSTLEVIIEGNGFNNSLAGYDNCNNSNLPVAAGGTNASKIWENSYLQDATKRFQKLSGDFKWNISDTYKCVGRSCCIISSANAPVVPKHSAPMKQLHLVTLPFVICLRTKNGKGLNIQSIFPLLETIISNRQRGRQWVSLMSRRFLLV